MSFDITDYDEVEETDENVLTFKKLQLQWLENKQKSESDTDYSIRINFLKLDLKEKYNGKK
jgi:hypothetical protein